MQIIKKNFFNYPEGDNKKKWVKEKSYVDYSISGAYYNNYD